MRRRTAFQSTLLKCVCCCLLVLGCTSITLVHAADLCSSGHPIYTQMQAAISLAEAHGYKNVSLTRIEDKGHERMADEVLAYFSSLMQ